MRGMLVILAGLLVTINSAEAGNNMGATLAGEAGAWNSSVNCQSLSRTECCFTPVTVTQPGFNNYAAVFVGFCPTPLDIVSVEFGITCSSAVIPVAWNRCGDSGIYTSNWPQSGSGARISWTTPQTGNVVLVGWFRVLTYTGYGPMFLSIAEHPTTGVARALDSRGLYDGLRRPAVVTWDGWYGGQNQWCNVDDPCCGPVPTQGTTWGLIKSQYAD